MRVSHPPRARALSAFLMPATARCGFIPLPINRWRNSLVNAKSGILGGSIYIALPGSFPRVCAAHRPTSIYTADGERSHLKFSITCPAKKREPYSRHIGCMLLKLSNQYLGFSIFVHRCSKWRSALLDVGQTLFMKWICTVKYCL